MNESSSSLSTRREFLKNTSRLAAVTSVAGAAIATQAGREALASDTLPPVHPGHSDTVQVALVGCGGRGTGAAGNALSTSRGPVKLVAMADVFEARLNSSFDTISKDHADKVEVPQDRKFVAFDGYKKAMDCLKPGD